MSIKFLVRQGGAAASQPDLANIDDTPREGVPIFDGDTPLVEIAQRWEQGTAGRGQFTYVDVHGTATYRFRPHVEVKLIEDESGDDVIIGWGRVEGGNDTGRRTPTGIGGDEVQHNSIGVMDCNLDLRGLPFRNGWSRPAETSWQRLQALEAAKLNGSSSTETLRRATTDIRVENFANGHLVDASDPIDLDAKDYPVGTHVNDVLADIMEEWGKGWGVTIHHAGGSHKCLLVQDMDDLSTFTSDLRISDQLADQNPTDPTAPTLEPIWRRSNGKTADNSDTISGLISIWGGTSDDPRHLYVETGEAPEDWETWVDVYDDDLAENATQAERRANTILNDRKRAYVTDQPSILLLPEQVTLITAGQAIEVKSVVLNQGPDKHEWVWKRIVEIVWEPSPDGRWWAHLSLERPRNTRPRQGGGQPGSTTPGPAPEYNPDPGDTLLKSYKGSVAVDGGDEINWDGIFKSDGTPPDGADGTGSNYFKSNSPDKYQDTWACSAGDVIRLDGWIACTSKGFLTLNFFAVGAGTDGGATGTPLASHVLSPAQPNHEHGSPYHWTHWSAGPFTAPTGTNSIALGRNGGAQFDEVFIYEVGDPAVNDDDAVNYGDTCPHDSTHFLPSDYVMCRLADIEGSLPQVIDDLGDVDTTTIPPADGDALVWDDSAEQWVPGAGATGDFLTKTGGEGHTISVVPDAGAAQTLDLTDANVFELTLTEDCTISAAGFTNGEWCEGLVIVHQDGTGGWALSYDTEFTFPDGMDGTLPDTADTTSAFWFGSLDGGATIYWATTGGGTTGGAGGHTIKENGTPLTDRAGLNFGSGIIAADDAGNDETDVDLDWAEDADVSTQAFGDAAATGTSQEVARGGHKHAMPVNPVTAHEAASDPHTGYVLESLLDAKGDLIAASADNTPAKVTVGANGTQLVARSGATPGVAWETKYASLSMVLGTGLEVIAVGLKGYVRVPFDCQIVRASLMADVSGSMEVDIWKDTWANYPPTDSDSITGGNELTLSSNDNGEDTTFTSWTTTTLAEGDVLGINVDTCSTIEQATLEIRVKLT